MNNILILLFIFNLNYSVISWKPIGNQIKTKWAHNLDLLNIWPEYPRPQLVRNDWVNLNGLWDYSITGEMDEEPVQYEGEILVPFGVESSLSGVMRPLGADQALWYKRNFTSNVGSDQRLILHFGAVDYECHVYINERFVGNHKGGYNKFSFDITKYFKVNINNTLVVKVIDKTDPKQPVGKQTRFPQDVWFTSTSGIWQTVWMERVPKTYVKDLVITTDIDKGSVDINVLTTNTLQKIDIKIFDKSGSVVASNSNALANKVITLEIRSPKLWSTNSPYLYDILIKAGNDSVTSYVGLRKIEIMTNSSGSKKIFLNRNKIFMFAILDHGYWPDGIYTPPNEEAMINDLLIARKLGFNSIRKHQKVESDRWYYATDKLGILVWQDFPSATDGVINGTRTPENARQIELEMERMITQLHNFPSIILWIPFNLDWGKYDIQRIGQLFKKTDPNRLIKASGYVEDIKTNVSKVLDDYKLFKGGILVIKDHIWGNYSDIISSHYSLKNAECNKQNELEKLFIDQLSHVKEDVLFKLGAVAYTQLTDVELEINGILTYDRIIKLENIDKISKAVNELYQLELVEEILASGHFSDNQEWNYTTNKPSDDWNQIEFNDTNWLKGKSGFAEEISSQFRTEWKSSDIFLRKEFYIKDNKLPEHPVLYLAIDDIAYVYINGQKIDKVFSLNWWFPIYPSPYSVHKINPILFKVGKNLIAIHCRNLQAPSQSIDVGILETNYFEDIYQRQEFKKKTFWELVWSQEFNNISKSEKWLSQENNCISESDEEKCLSSSTINVKIIDGVLALSAHQDKEELKKDFYSFRSVDVFSFGKLEMRAAMPQGSSLRVLLYLETEMANTPRISMERTRIYLIDFIYVGTLRKRMILNNLVQLQDNNKHNFITKYTDEVIPALGENFNNFNNYSFEWNESDIKFEFNSRKISSNDITVTNNKQFNNLTLNLKIEVNGFPYINETTTHDWLCPSLLIDYIRHYKRSYNKSITNYTLKETTSLRDNICKKLMQKSNNISPLFWIILTLILFISIIIIIIIGIIIFVLKLKKNQIKKDRTVTFFEKDSDHEYAEVIYDNYYLPIEGTPVYETFNVNVPTELNEQNQFNGIN